jgi:hypothetical protein
MRINRPTEERLQIEIKRMKAVRSHLKESGGRLSSSTQRELSAYPRWINAAINAAVIKRVEYGRYAFLLDNINAVHAENLIEAQKQLWREDNRKKKERSEGNAIEPQEKTRKKRGRPRKVEKEKVPTKDSGGLSRKKKFPPKKDPLTGEVFVPKHGNQKFANSKNQVSYKNNRRKPKKRAQQKNKIEKRKRFSLVIFWGLLKVEVN